MFIYVDVKLFMTIKIFKGLRKNWFKSYIIQIKYNLTFRVNPYEKPRKVLL